MPAPSDSIPIHPVYPLKRIRNFSIIAHIDHGKSTLADAILSHTGALSQREEKEQFLDRMDLERERGITIKAQSVCLPYKSPSGELYQLNLIDTPGHVDFSYEVSRSLAACEGAILVVDATQGVEAQTLSNVYLALENDLHLLPVLNKIDLPASDVEGVKKQIQELMGLPPEEVLEVSAKARQGIGELLEALVQRIPHPTPAPETAPLRALVFDSWFDSYRGVILLVRIMEGCLKKGDRAFFMASQRDYEALGLGVYSPFMEERKQLSCGEVGFVICGVKNIHDVTIGDTLTLKESKATKALPGFREVQPMVFSGIFPLDSEDHAHLKEALEKLALNDASLTFEVEKSAALGFGFRCGFLGLLHMEIVRERLEREFSLNLINTLPTVIYHLELTSGEKIELENPAQMPHSTKIRRIEEPYVRVSLHSPSEFIGSILKLCEERRGEQLKMDYITPEKVLIEYKLPLNEVVLDFYDRLKSLSRGYASMEYEMMEYEPADLQKLDILINGQVVDALSFIVHKHKAARRGRLLAEKMKTLIPRQQFQVAIQAALGSKIVARENVPALRKDVTAKCYGGDISRKRKLLEKQREGKKRMKQIGSVELPQEAFLAVLQVNED